MTTLGAAYYAKLTPLRENNVIRRILFCRDGFRCAYCEIAVNFKSGTVDHVVPKDHFSKQGLSKSKASVWTNMVVACEPCNSRKANKLCEDLGLRPKADMINPQMVRLDHHGKVRLVQSQFVEQYYIVEPGSDVLVPVRSVPSS